MAAGRGRNARTPAQIPRRGWKDILLRVWDEASDDHLSLVAAGATFYLLLALFPALAALVSIYGLVAEPAEIEAQVAALSAVLPAGAVEVVTDQLRRVAAARTGGLSFGFAGGLLLSLWSANKGTKGLMEALDIVYEEDERRGFLRLSLVSLAMTLLALAVAILVLAGIVVLPLVLRAAGLGEVATLSISLLRWPVLLGGVFLVVTLFYRYGPSRRRARWRWVTWGSVAACLCWLAMSLAFSWYVASFGSYNQTYGSLGAVIGFMVWLWLSLLVVLLGAELNAEMEHQTARDTTVGEERPMGRRGATMADTVGESRG